MTERAKPYIGVSGVGSRDMQHRLIDMFDTANLTNDRDLMLGVKALHKCQWLDQPWSRDDAWDIVGERTFRTVLERDARTTNVAQAYFDARDVGDTWYRHAFLERIYARGANWIDGIQFDSFPWHENRDMLTFLHETKERFPDTRIYLQCHEKSMQRYTPVQLAKLLGAHAKALDYILFDASHGKGVRLNVAQLSPYIEEAYESAALAHVGVALAGGLYGPVVREDLPELVAAFPDLSWDAEGKLHPADEEGRMGLDETRVRDYFAASAEVLHLNG